MTSVVIRDVAKLPEQATNLVRKALWLKIPFMTLGVIGSVTASWVLGYDALVRDLVMIASLVMLADAISLLFYGVLRGHHALRFESIGIFLGQTCTLVFGGAVLLIHPSLRLLIFALLAGSIFNMVYSAYHVVRLLGIQTLRPEWDNILTKKMLVAALPFAFAGIFVKVYSYVDSVFISKFIGTAAVGIYAVAYKFTYSFQFLPMALVAALYPRMSSLVGKDNAGLQRLFDDAIWYLAVLAVPISFGLFAVAPDAVALAGEGYEGAVPILQVLIFVLIPIFLDFPVGSLLNAAGRQGTKTTIMGITMLINILLNALLIPRYGVMGAAYSAIASFTFLLFGGLHFVSQVIPTYSMRLFFRTTASIFGCGAAMGIVAVVLRPFLGFILVIPLAAICYVAMLFLTRSVRTVHLKNAFNRFRRRPIYVEDSAIHD